MAREKNKNRTALLAQRAQRGLCDLILETRGGIAAEIAGLDGEGAPFALDARRVAHQPGDACAIKGRRHHEKAQILAQSALHIERKRKAEIAVERALVKLVEQHGRDALERGIVENHSREDAFRDHLDAGASGDEALQANPQADRFANLFRQVRGHACSGSPGGEAARLQDDDLAALCERFIEKREGNPRRLAGAGGRDEDGATARPQRGGDLRQDVVNRQRVGEGAHCALIAAASPRRKLKSPVGFARILAEPIGPRRAAQTSSCRKRAPEV